MPAVTGELVVDEVVHEAELVDELGSRLGFDDVYHEWIEKHRAKSRNTAAAYERNFNEWCDWLDSQGVVDVFGVRVRQVERWKEHLQVAINPRTSKPLAPASIAQRIAAVSSFYVMARRMEVIVRNPAEDAERPSVDPHSSNERELTEEEAQRLIDTALEIATTRRTKDTRRVAMRDAEIITFIGCTGVRVSEACAARVEDLGYKRGHRVCRVRRKGGKVDAVALGACTEMVDRRVSGRVEGLIWTTRSGRQVSRAWVFHTLRRIALAADIPDPDTVGPHALRAAFAMVSLDNGASIYDLALAMGHSDPRTTTRYDRRRSRIDNSPVHQTSRRLLRRDPQRDQLF